MNFEERVRLCMGAMRAAGYIPTSCTQDPPAPLYEKLKSHGRAVINEAQFRIITYRIHAFIPHPDSRLSATFTGEDADPCCVRCGLGARAEIHVQSVKAQRRVPNERKSPSQKPSPKQK
jgi:hypothetical protein